MSLDCVQDSVTQDGRNTPREALTSDLAHHAALCPLMTDHYYYYYSKVQLDILLLYTGLKTVFSRCENVAKDQNTRDHLAWTAGNGDPMHEVCIPAEYLAHVNSRGEI